MHAPLFILFFLFRSGDSLILIRMDRFHLSPMNHEYEYIDCEPSTLVTKRRNSESDLLRLVGQELEIINHLIKKVPMTSQKADTTFSLYEQVEQGFYKCHDSIYDVPEGLRIPDLRKKKAVQKKSISKRRLSLDSGRGTSVDGDTDVSLLDSSFASSSQPSLKANDLLELNTSDALDRICGTSSLESLPGQDLLH